MANQIQKSGARLFKQVRLFGKIRWYVTSYDPYWFPHAARNPSNMSHVQTDRLIANPRLKNSVISIFCDVNRKQCWVLMVNV